MSDGQTTKEQKIQTQHVLEVSSGNLNVVIDQLQSLEDSRVKGVLKSLETAKSDLSKLVKT